MELEKEIDQQKAFGSVYHKPMINVLFTANCLELEHLRTFKQYGITMQQYNVLRILRGCHPRAATIQYVSARMLDRSSNASRLVDKLMVKNLVDRAICPHNRRAVDVVITYKGLDLLSQIDIHEPGWISKANHLSEQEAQTLNTLLDKLRGPDREVPASLTTLIAEQALSDGKSPC